MNTERNNLIAEAVLNNVTFAYMGSGTYTVQDLYNGRLNESSVRKLGKIYEAKIAEKTSSKFSTSRVTKTQRENELRVDILVDVLAMIKDAKDAAKAKEEKAARAAVIRGVIERKKFEKLEDTALDALQKELADLEA